MSERLNSAAASGVVALIFLILGFQAALFMGNVFKSNKQEKFTCVKIENTETTQSIDSTAQINLDHTNTNLIDKVANKVISDEFHNKKTDYGDSRVVIAEKYIKKDIKLFNFNPNTISLNELQLLGFSEKQALVIVNYRDKGGKFTNKRDFAKMYVVDSSTYFKLEPYIQIPKININRADSAELTLLNGIGPYYANKIIEYRNRLKGFNTIKQLLEIDGIDSSRLEQFKDQLDTLYCSQFNIWSATEKELAEHPYIGNYAAKGILRYKNLTDSILWNIDDLVSTGILKENSANKLQNKNSTYENHM